MVNDHWMPGLPLALALSVPAILTLCLNESECATLVVCASSALGMVAWIAVRDMRDFIIPDAPLISIAVLALALRVTSAGPSWPNEVTLALLDALFCGGAVFVLRETYFRLRGYDGIGFGDVKLVAAGGMLIGTIDMALAILAASLTGISIILGALVLSRRDAIERLPFGALLGPACWVIWFSGRLLSP